MKTCFLFPGQGAQYPGMGRDLWENSDRVKQLFQLASDTTGMDVRTLLFEGSADDLKATDKTQVAISTVNLSAALLLKERGILPEGCAGFSLGEYAALVEAGILTAQDMFHLVKRRGDLMEKVSRSLDSPAGNPGMAAVIGLSFEAVSALAGETDGVYVANYNSPAQIVVSGTAAGLDAFEVLCKEKGARRVIRLKVSGPFHSPLLADARDAFAEAVESVAFSDPVLPVYSNVSGRIIRSGAEAKELSVAQIVSAVRWVDEEQAILTDGFQRCLEAGPGTVLCGLWKNISQEVLCMPAGKAEDIEKLES